MEKTLPLVHFYIINIIRNFDEPLHNKGGIHWSFYVKQTSKDVIFEEIEIKLSGYDNR